MIGAALDFGLLVFPGQDVGAEAVFHAVFA